MPREFRGSLDNIIFRPGTLVGQLTARTKRPGLTEHAVARRDLERYYSLLDPTDIVISKSGLETLKHLVEKGQTSNLDKIRLLSTEAEKAGDISLATKLENMTPFELITLVDATEKLIIDKGE